jgi:transposase-like protein
VTCPEIALQKSSKVMDKRERKFYSEELKEQVLTAYHNSDESVSKIAIRFQVNRDTVSSWVYRKRTEPSSQKSIKFVPSESSLMKNRDLSPEEMAIRIRELERQLQTEKMRSQCLDKMIEIAERELKIDIRKKSGARQSLR